ncbi:MAG: ADP-ribosylglycohydrolase family protein [Pseudomonadota bacterium]
MEKYERYAGALLGLAVGDALGTTIEFSPPGTFEPVEDMVGGGPFGLKPGQWTDDTSLALCLAESLVEKGEFDPVDQLERYVRWYRHGHLSSTGRCFDIGGTTSHALWTFEQTKNPYSGSTDTRSAGNGSLMRLAPVPLFFANDPALGMAMSGESSRTTHGNILCVDACRYFGGLIIGAVSGASKEELVSERYSPIPDYWKLNPPADEIDEVAGGSFRRKEPPEIKGSGYVVKSLEAALWAFHKTNSFEEGCLTAVNLGDDADTTGAIYGQIAGAFYGINQIPRKWLDILALKDTIEALAHGLCKRGSVQ